jgi:predicted component of type VI protein secretion system
VNSTKSKKLLSEEGEGTIGRGDWDWDIENEGGI